jgi:FMN reductase
LAMSRSLSRASKNDVNRPLAPEDWGDLELNKRIDRAALELVLLMESGFARKIKAEAWNSYQHSYGSAGGTEVSIDLDSDLMRLATGGSAA